MRAGVSANDDDVGGSQVVIARFAAPNCRGTLQLLGNLFSGAVGGTLSVSSTRKDLEAN